MASIVCEDSLPQPRQAPPSPLHPGVGPAPTLLWSVKQPRRPLAWAVLQPSLLAASHSRHKPLGEGPCSFDSYGQSLGFSYERKSFHPCCWSMWGFVAVRCDGPFCSALGFFFSLINKYKERGHFIHEYVKRTAQVKCLKVGKCHKESCWQQSFWPFRHVHGDTAFNYVAPLFLMQGMLSGVEEAGDADVLLTVRCALTGGKR